MRWYSFCIITLYVEVFFKYTGDGYLYGVIVYCTCSGIFFSRKGERGRRGDIADYTRGPPPISSRETTVPIPGSKHPLPNVPPGSPKLNPRTPNRACVSFPLLVHFPKVSAVKLSRSFCISPPSSFTNSYPYFLEGTEDPTLPSLLLMASVALGHRTFKRRTLRLYDVTS